MGVWAILVGCIIGEVIAMSLLTKSEGFTQPLYGILSLVIYGGVIWVLSYVLTQLPMGVVYAVWSGMGIALICITGWAVLQQPLTSVQVLCIALIIGGAEKDAQVTIHDLPDISRPAQFWARPHAYAQLVQDWHALTPVLRGAGAWVWRDALRMSAPTIAKGRVFTSFPADGRAHHQEASHLLGAFDLDDQQSLDVKRIAGAARHDRSTRWLHLERRVRAVDLRHPDRRCRGHADHGECSGRGEQGDEPSSHHGPPSRRESGLGVVPTHVVDTREIGGSPPSAV
jgi:small multidrug resistance pump